MMRCRILSLLWLLVLLPTISHGFSPALLSTVVVAPATATAVNNGKAAAPTAPSTTIEPVATKDVVTTVAVAGATGRTGRYVVQELLDRGVDKVIAIVRDMSKAQDVLLLLGGIDKQQQQKDRLEVVQCNLANPDEIAQVLQGADAAIWCATGFSDAPTSGLVAKAKQLLGMALTPQQSIDLVGLPAVAEALAAASSSKDDPTKEEGGNSSSSSSRSSDLLPQVVMCSSSGVTRPIWSEAKKERFPGAADIPIVRLNPFSILDRKRESEEQLRNSGVNYCIVRPCGLNDDWPAGSRPIVSQGDVAVGRMNRKDVASLLVDVLSLPEATGKTFEVVGLAGYPRPASIAPSLARLYRDGDALLASEENLMATYVTMQQLLPGEKQDAAALAMGQTYEQLDKGETGRLGERGKENIAGAAPKPTSSP